jgi:hypothetical protein
MAWAEEACRVVEKAMNGLIGAMRAAVLAWPEEMRGIASGTRFELACIPSITLHLLTNFGDQQSKKSVNGLVKSSLV